VLVFAHVMGDYSRVDRVCFNVPATRLGFVTTSGYRVPKGGPALPRKLTDQLNGSAIAGLHAKNYCVYGIRKMHRLHKHDGWEVGRDQKKSLMNSSELRQVKDRRRGAAGKSGPAGPPLRPPAATLLRGRTAQALGCRCAFCMELPGPTYVALVSDVLCRPAVGPEVTCVLRADIVSLHALKGAVFNVGGHLTGLAHNSDHGSTYLLRLCG
jgi:hypothetical protein